MSIDSDVSKYTLSRFQNPEQGYADQQKSAETRYKEAKVVHELADIGKTEGSVKDFDNEQSSNPILDIERVFDTQNLENANIKMRQLNVGLSFETVEDSSDRIVKVIDQETGDVVRQIPSEEFIKMSQRLDEIFGELKELKGSLINNDV